MKSSSAIEEQSPSHHWPCQLAPVTSAKAATTKSNANIDNKNTNTNITARRNQIPELIKELTKQCLRHPSNPKTTSNHKMPQAKTLKQAKAAFKARDENPITEREAKQLERALQLDRRAWALREREKTRADLTKKRLAQEKAQKDEERRLGTQRRRDRFGFKSSQFHLGAFFQKPGVNLAEGNAVAEENKSEAVGDMGRRHEQGRDAGVVAQHNAADDDEFEDEFEDSVDDESLLEALQSPESVRTMKPAEKSPSYTKSATTTAAAAATSMPPPPLPLSKMTLKPPVPASARVSAPTPNPPPFDQEWHSFLSSSTQIARELSDTQESSPPHRSNPPEPIAAAAAPPAQEPPRTNSFSSAGSSSSSFDLTEDDLEKLDPTTPSAGAAKRDEERARMPPPPLPLPGVLKQGSRQGSEKEKGNDFRKDAPRPTHPAARMNQSFTMTELESFVDEDLQLTQAS